MAHKMLLKCKNLLFLSTVLPFVYGCNGGGGSSLLGSLFGGSGGGILGSGLLSGGGGGDGIATVAQPEPATMLLLGSGVIAMGYLSNRTKKR